MKFTVVVDVSEFAPYLKKKGVFLAQVSFPLSLGNELKVKINNFLLTPQYSTIPLTTTTEISTTV